MSRYPRRPRSEGERRKRRSDGGGWWTIVPLIVLVVFAGLLLGGLLGRFFSKNTPAIAAFTPVPSITPLRSQAPATPMPSPSVRDTATPSPEPTLNDSPAPKPTATSIETAAPRVLASPAPRTPGVTVIVTPQPAASADEVAKITTTPVPTISPTPVVTVAPPTPSVPLTRADRAAGVVRAYLKALARGDHATATSYLAQGEPDESFIDAGAKITAVHATENTGGSYKVTADVLTATGEYFETFTVERGPQGYAITEHFAIKP